jgi:hypothetical protein
MIKSALIFAGLAGMISGSPAMAAKIAALVEDVSDAPSDIVPLDYLQSGKIVELGTKGRLILGYIGSCTRETIQGGTVTVGDAESIVAAGSIKREKVECDGGHLQLAANTAAGAGVMVMRGKPPVPTPVTNPNAPRLRLYGTSPMVEVGTARLLTIERLDVSEPKRDIPVADGQLAGGRFLDFAAINQNLKPGGIYRLAAEGKSMVVIVDRTAKPGKSPLLGRLVKF